MIIIVAAHLCLFNQVIELIRLANSNVIRYTNDRAMYLQIRVNMCKKGLVTLFYFAYVYLHKQIHCSIICFLLCMKCHSYKILNFYTTKTKHRYFDTFTNGLLSGALFSHLVDIPPVPPPHGSAAPPFGQRVGISSSTVRHRDDCLSVVLIASSKRALGIAQVGRSGNYSSVLRHRAKPLAVAD